MAIRQGELPSDCGRTEGGFRIARNWNWVPGTCSGIRDVLFGDDLAEGEYGPVEKLQKELCQYWGKSHERSCCDERVDCL